jgi:hypothetical protein
MSRGVCRQCSAAPAVLDVLCRLREVAKNAHGSLGELRQQLAGFSRGFRVRRIQRLRHDEAPEESWIGERS